VRGCEKWIFTHSGVKVELGQIILWGELPGVLQVESNCAGITLGRGDESPERTLSQPHRTVVDLETSDWESPSEGGGEEAGQRTA